MKKQVNIFVRIFCGLIIIFFIAIGFLIFEHPILIKFIAGEAKIIGKPVIATVYIDGYATDNIKVFKNVDNNIRRNPDDYILALQEFDKDGMLKYIDVDLHDKLVERSVGTSANDYDIINGYLLQSETGSRFVDFRDNIKGFNFDPQLAYTGKQITFHLPHGWLRFNSIKIVYNQPAIQTTNCKL